MAIVWDSAAKHVEQGGSVVATNQAEMALVDRFAEQAGRHEAGEAERMMPCRVGSVEYEETL